MNNNLLTQESQDKSISLITEGLSENKTENDILVEDTKDVENKNLLKKKRTKDKDKEGETKGKFIYKTCYICKQKLGLDNISKFYGSLCTKCGDYNYSFRTMKLDFSGRIAIVTGGRIKIGFYIVTKLLSYGCKVITTSRFPKDALFKFKEDPDYDIWKNNLFIYPIDFRIFESTVKFIKFIEKTFPCVDILINNAAQTIRRNADYYNYLLPIESKQFDEEDEKKIIKNDYVSIQNISNIPLLYEQTMSKINNSLDLKSKKELLPLSVITSQIKIIDEKEQPNNIMIGNDGQPYDFVEGKNSWTMEIDEVSFQEFSEVQIINCWTPYYLIIKLLPLLKKSKFKDRYIVNVTSMEGIINERIAKRTSHVHTNMAKAGLNMMTRTAADYLKNYGVYMTCVDTGKISLTREMNKILKNEKEKEKFELEFFNIPLDELDGAMRVLHPIIEGITNKKYLYGVLLHNFKEYCW
jgi:NAD(P)-dependent dehydrogenase (short-subunit alcohol dehydrogenase family)